VGGEMAEVEESAFALLACVSAALARNWKGWACFCLLDRAQRIAADGHKTAMCVERDLEPLASSSNSLIRKPQRMWPLGTPNLAVSPSHSRGCSIVDDEVLLTLYLPGTNHTAYRPTTRARQYIWNHGKAPPKQHHHNCLM
jgi:hypothetical protein